MEKFSQNLFLKALVLLSWIIFIGVCFEAGAFIISTGCMLYFDPSLHARLYQEIDLTQLFSQNKTLFITLTSLMIIVAILRAILFWIIVKLLHEKRLNFSKPFNEYLPEFIQKMAFLSLGIGIFSGWASGVSESINNAGIDIPSISKLRVAGADVWVFMSIILFVIHQLVKRGVEIQTENELTV